MPTKKSVSPSKKKAQPRRAGAKAIAARGPLPPYGVPIREAIARGDVREMRKVAAAARKWQKNVETALAQMEKLMKQLEG